MPRKKKSRIYFGAETENAIVRYNSETDPTIKEQIYRDKIEYPLNKLVENIINRFKFPYYFDSTENIKKEVISFLISNLHKYEQDKGKAFSYFSVITKNHLILENRARYEHLKTHRSIDIPDPNFDVLDEDLYHRANDDTVEFINLFIEFWENNLRTVFKKKKDILVADAILELFRSAGDIENFNKKALYVLIREMTGIKTQYITSVINKMKEHTERVLQEYYSKGIFDTDNIEEFFF
jgi:hypothetical protein